ncbi:MAG TPA: hypothetical protein VFO67_14460 [Gemmatimonadales bacterium]|nr:hypothetical protein [Gemmatimonadales bacterium]
MPPAAPPAPVPSKLEGMWSDPPPTAVGTLCFFACTDAAIDRLNTLLDDPANDDRPFPELSAAAQKHQQDTYFRPRLTDNALKTYPLDPADDPGFLRCEPWGLAKQMFAPHQLEIRRSGDNQIELRYGEWEARRTVYLDGRTAPADLAPSRLGFSVGRWDGDTLVVETSRVAAGITWWDAQHSDQFRVVEHFTRSEDGSTLNLTATIEDPWSLREPVVAKKVWRWAPDQKITPYDACEPATEFKKGTSEQP